MMGAPHKQSPTVCELLNQKGVKVQSTRNGNNSDGKMMLGSPRSYSNSVKDKEIPTERPYLSAITIGLGYLVGGIIPLVPYFFVSRAHVALLYSCILTGAVLLVFGAVKARVTGAGNNVAGYVWGAVSTLTVGGAAAAAAYGIVAFFEREP